MSSGLTALLFYQ